RRGAQTNLIPDNLGISGDRALASATHRTEKGALGGYALPRIEVIEPFADSLDPFIPGPDLDTQSALSDARQHRFRFQNDGQQTVRDGVSLQLALRCHAKVQALQPRGR